MNVDAILFTEISVFRINIIQGGLKTICPTIINYLSEKIQQW